MIDFILGAVTSALIGVAAFGLAGIMLVIVMEMTDHRGRHSK